MRARGALVAASAVCLAGCAAAAAVGPARVVPLGNPGFEAAARPGEKCAEHWSCTMHSDVDSFRFLLDARQPAEGRQSLCVERVKNEPWALVTQGLHDPKLRGARLRFSAAVRVERAEGAGAGPWAVVHGPQGNLAQAQRLARATGGGWQRHSVEFVVGAAAQSVEVGLTLEGGGRACIDDARLEILPD